LIVTITGQCSRSEGIVVGAKSRVRSGRTIVARRRVSAACVPSQAGAERCKSMAMIRNAALCVKLPAAGVRRARGAVVEASLQAGR